MASSLIFLGIGVVLFIIVFGLIVNIAAAVLAAVFDALNALMKVLDVREDWKMTYESINSTSQYLILMIMSLGIVLIVVKVIMVAAARGRE